MHREYAAHPAAEIFPLMEGETFNELVADIEANGLREPILRMPDGRILDGRNRYRACLVAQVEPAFTTYGGTDPWGEVVSKNLHRRHLTDAQRAMIAARLAERERGVRGPGKQKDGASEPSFSDRPPTQAEAERLFGVSHGSVKRARAVQRTGTPKLVAAVEAGSLPIRTAERVAKTLTPEEQDEYVTQPKKGPQEKEEATSQTPKVVDGRSDRRPAAERAQQIRELAARNYTSRQIADALGFSRPEWVGKLAREHEIEIPADAVVGQRSRRINPERVISETVAALEGVCSGIALLEPDQYATLDPESAARWSSSLADSIKSLTKLRKELDRAQG